MTVQMERMGTETSSSQDDSDVLVLILIRDGHEVSLFRGGRDPVRIVFDGKQSGDGVVFNRVDLAVDGGLKLRSDNNRESDVDVVNEGGLLNGNRVGLVEEGGIRLQERIVDVGAVGVGNVQSRRLRHWDGST